MTEKTFDRADLLKFFDEQGHAATVAKLTVIMPVKSLYDETTTERYPIAAETQAMFCEKYGFAVAVQRVACEGLYHLPKDHFLRTEKPLHFRYGAGATSAELSRWAMQLADDWRSTVRAFAPRETLDLAQRVPEPAPDEDHDATGVSIDDPFGDEAAGAQ